MKIKTLENQELRFCNSKKTIKYVLKRENLKILFFHTILFRVQYDHAIVKNLNISLAFLLSFYFPNHCARCSAKVQMRRSRVQKCKGESRAWGSDRGRKTFRVAGGSPGWQVAGMNWVGR